MTLTTVVSTVTPDMIERALPVYDPAYAFIVHSQRTEKAGVNSSGQQAVLTLHPVLCRASKAPQIGPGTIMGSEDINTLLARLGGDFSRANDQAVSILPPNVLTVEAQGVTWFVPGTRRPMHYRTPAGKGVFFDVVWPHLVFRAYKSKLHVAALASAERPCADTALLHAPLANVNVAGEVCTGSATLPRSTDVNSMRDWEAVVYRTYFTHQNHPNTLRGGSTSESLMAFWKDRQGRRTPPAARLMNSMGLTLRNWLAAIVRSEST